MHDQVRLAWLHGNADRTRRLIEDGWIVRLCYPVFLLIPLRDATTPHRWLCVCAGLLVRGLWVWGIFRLVRAGRFFRRPAASTDNLRDIVYLALALSPPHLQPGKAYRGVGKLCTR